MSGGASAQPRPPVRPRDSVTPSGPITSGLISMTRPGRRYTSATNGWPNRYYPSIGSQTVKENCHMTRMKLNLLFYLFFANKLFFFQADSLVTNLRDSFKEIIQTRDWMDDNTKVK